VYYTEDYRNFVLNHRSSFNTLAQALLDEGDKERARKALLFSLERMPDVSIDFDYTTARTVALLYMVDANDKAKEVAQTLGDRSLEMLDYLIESGNGSMGYEIQVNLVILADF
jgi:hypothetical protein